MCMYSQNIVLGKKLEQNRGCLITNVGNVITVAILYPSNVFISLVLQNKKNALSHSKANTDRQMAWTEHKQNTQETSEWYTSIT